MSEKVKNKMKKTKVSQPVGVIEAPRYGCALAGVYESVIALNKAVPILHSGPGCGTSQLHGGTYPAGQNAPGDYGGTSTPCSCLVEEHVIFGGEKKLRDLIESSLKLLNAEFFVVTSGCVPSLIGDDVDAVVKEFRGQAPIINVNAPGFSGNTFYGYELFFESLIDQFLTEKPVQKRLVNILGIVPFQHIFWKGDLKVIKDLLANIGIESNILFTEFDALEKLERIPAAEYNIVLSPWVGHSIAQKLEDKFQTPYLTFPGVPIGPKQTTKFIKTIKKALKLRSNKIDEFIENQEREIYRLMEYAGDNILIQNPHAYFAVVADSNLAINLTRFLVDEVGQLPDIIQLTDDPPEEYREKIIKELSGSEEIEFAPDIVFEGDSWEIKENLKDRPFLFLLASSLESHIAEEELNAVNLTVSYPAYNRLILRDSYAGYEGGAHLLENIRSVKLGPL